MMALTEGGVCVSVCVCICVCVYLKICVPLVFSFLRKAFPGYLALTLSYKDSTKTIYCVFNVFFKTHKITNISTERIHFSK